MRKLGFGLAAAAGAALLSVAAVQAQNGPPPLPGQQDVSRVTAGTYATDAGHSLVAWKVDHFGFNDYFGVFGDVAGTLELDPADLSSAKVDVTIPIASVSVASEGLKEHLMRAGRDGAAPDFFGPEPEAARFVSTSVRTTGPTSAVITGMLTLNGQTHPVAIGADFVGAGANPMNQKETVGFHGRASIKRSDFGINFAIPFVSDEVMLDISVAFEKQ